MKLAVTGASGFVGTHLCRFMLGRGHEVIGFGRSAGNNRVAHDAYRFVEADTTRPGAWQSALSEADAVVNLAGRSIFGRWSEAIKAEIRDSRILTTRHAVQAISSGRKTVFISASGVGFYGSRGDDELTEDAPAGADFLSGLSVDWEKEALAAAQKKARVVVMRLGVVLGAGGGAMAQMIPAFRRFAGGPIGDGRQWFPWIHLDDLAAAVDFLLATPDIRGPVNLCAPNPVRNRELAAALGKALNRPAFVPAPAFVLRMLLGEFSEVLLGSQRAVPRRLLQHRFAFKYPDIAGAVQAVIQAEAA
jgi:uncharacterized protein (TIGR01777 family)